MKVLFSWLCRLRQTTIEPAGADGIMRRTIEITGEYIRLCDLLKFASVCQTGGEAKSMILEEKVLVNGEVCLHKGKKIQPEDVVLYDDQEICVQIGAQMI